MASKIYVEGEFNNSLLHSFDRSLKAISPKEKTIIISINSIGGNLGTFTEMSMLISKRHKLGCTIIGQAVRVESAAMKFFLNCDEREVDPGSSGTIHLPVPNQEVSQKEYEETRDKAIEYIRRKTGLSTKEIVDLDGKELGSNEMIKYRIAHRKVVTF